MPEVPDLEALNLSLVEWLEDVFQDSPDRNTLNDNFEEEDEHWTNIARSLSKQQLIELDERIKYLDAVRSGLRSLQDKASADYYTKGEKYAYVERRVSEGCGRWRAKGEADTRKYVPPKEKEGTLKVKKIINPIE